MAQGDGRPIRPEHLTHRFRVLVSELDLPPIRLHDLRHGAATIALASRTDLKVIEDARPLQHRHHRRHLHQLSGIASAGRALPGLAAM